jgi:hypothetical protein
MTKHADGDTGMRTFQTAAGPFSQEVVRDTRGWCSHLESRIAARALLCLFCCTYTYCFVTATLVTGDTTGTPPLPPKMASSSDKTEKRAQEATVTLETLAPQHILMTHICLDCFWLVDAVFRSHSHLCKKDKNKPRITLYPAQACTVKTVAVVSPRSRSTPWPNHLDLIDAGDQEAEQKAFASLLQLSMTLMQTPNHPQTIAIANRKRKRDFEEFERRLRLHRKIHEEDARRDKRYR